MSYNTAKSLDEDSAVPNNEFAEWIADQVEGDDAKFDSYREMGRRTGVSHTTLRRLRDGDPPSIKVLKKLANTLLVPLEDLQRMAGILEQDQEIHDELTGMLQSIMKRLPEEGKRAMIALGKELLRQQNAGH